MDNSSQIQPNVISYSSSQPSSTTFVSTYFNNSNSEIALAGTFQGTITLPSATVVPVSNGFTDIFIVGMSLFPVNTQSELLQKKINIKIFPNPTNDFVNIEFDNFEKINHNQIITVHLYNQIGQLQRTIFINKKTERIDISHLSKGIYFLKIKNQTFKVVLI